MHELSIVNALVGMVEEKARAAGATRVTRVQIRVGALSGVVAEALRFSYDFGTTGTLLEGSTLAIEEVPVAIACLACGRDVVLPGIQHFCCPDCGTPSARVTQGRELDLLSFEIETPDPEPTGAPGADS